KTLKIPYMIHLMQKNILTGSEILQACQKIFFLPVFDLDNYDINACALLSAELVREYRVIPLAKNNNILQLGIADPTDQDAIEAIAFHTQATIKLFLVNVEKLMDLINNQYGNQEANINLQHHLLKQITLDEKNYSLQDKMTSYDEPLIQLVDNIILHAFQQKASDIHLEAHETFCRIRYRQHGILFLVNEIPAPLTSRIMTRLKVMGKLNIAEKRLPQDGRFQV